MKLPHAAAPPLDCDRVIFLLLHNQIDKENYFCVSFFDCHTVSAGHLTYTKNRNVHLGHSCLFHTNQKLFPMRAMGPMRVARLINKRYNHNRKQNSTAAAGSANSPPPGATGSLYRRVIIPISLPYGKRVFRTARDYYSLCSAFLSPNIFYARRQNHEKAKAEPSPSHRAPYGALVGSPASCTRPRPTRHPPSAMIWATPPALSCR